MEKIKKFLEKKVFLQNLLYAIYIIFTMSILFVFITTPYVKEFFSSIENKTFDVRQNLIAKHKKINKDIVIVSVDERSYEYLLEKYGEWPISRNIYADIIKHIEKQNPSVIAFDLMFVKSIKSSNNADNNLAQNINKYDNVFTAINFDDQLSELRTPANLPNGLKANLKNESNIDLKKWLSFTNCRTIITQILNTTPNIGHINLYRDNDGIAREMALFVAYKDDFYPHLALKVAMKHLEKTENLKQKDFIIDKNKNISIGNRIVPLNENGSAILNWYGPSGINSKDTFTYIPIWQIEKDMYENGNFLPKDYFKNKIIYVGTSATSLYDLKSVPTDKIFPGVEIHTTFINNLLNNEFIKKTSTLVDITIALILGIFIGGVVIKSKSTIISSIITILSCIVYIIATIFAMFEWNLWVGIILPLVTVTIVFISCYIVKYIIKSKDLEYTYALATTDGLTDLYNHRYFQEQMQQNVATCKRYNKDFSLIMIDIDYFKKFNDTYGHQSGDAVLRQVAQILKKNVRSSDIVCRYGGEEMAIILTNTGNEEALITAQKICNAVSSQPLKLVNGNNVNVTISLGVATCPLNGEEPAEMIKFADNCLYKAKEHGRNQVGNLAKD